MNKFFNDHNDCLCAIGVLLLGWKKKKAEYSRLMC